MYVYIYIYLYIYVRMYTRCPATSSKLADVHVQATELQREAHAEEDEVEGRPARVVLV